MNQVRQGGALHSWRAFRGIAGRETLRLLRQRGRLASALVRPLVWLVLFGAGLRSVLGLPPVPPYGTYITYDTYIVPGLCGMMLLFHGLQSSLAMVYDRETGTMRLFLTAPLPRWRLLAFRLIANALAVLPLVYCFLAFAWFWEVRAPLLGYLAVLPALVVAGLMLGAIGLALSAFIREIENFAGVMNFVIFPSFFASTALYPLWRLDDVSAWLGWAAWLNPFSYAVELIRFSLYLRFEPVSALVCIGATMGFFAIAVRGYDPGRGLFPGKPKREEPNGGTKM